MRRPGAAGSLAALLGGAGILHFVIPAPYESIVPRRLGHARAFVLVSGAAELACAAAVAHPATRRRGALAGAALFVAVFPANVSMALDRSRPAREHRAALVRLPLQAPLVWWAISVARSAARHEPDRHAA